MNDHYLSSISPINISKLVHRLFDLVVTVKQLPGYIDLNFLLTTAEKTNYVLKIANAQEPEIELDMQNAVMQFLANEPLKGYQFPQVIHSVDGHLITPIKLDGEMRYLRLLTYVDGEFFADKTNKNDRLFANFGQFLGQLANKLQHFSHPAVGRYLIWDLKHASHVIRGKRQYLNQPQHRQWVEKILAQFESQVLPFATELPVAVIHNDANDYNLLCQQKHDDKIVGLIDFGDMVESYQINELAIAIAYAILDQKNMAEIIETMALNYHQFRPLLAVECHVLPHLICARLAVSVCNSAHAIKNEPNNEYLLISEQPAWRAIEQLMAIDLTSLALRLSSLCSSQKQGRDSAALRESRANHLFHALSLSYQQPLKIVRGSGQYLYDDTGKRYLDLVNNVCHVGHCHPNVVRAGQQQMALLNTNTRYLHDNIVDYSERLLAKFPESLSVVMFVNSGSEANELAMRLVKAHTKSQNMIVVEGAYHGNTNKAVEISPYKFNGPGGEGPSENISIVPMPDPYRGEFKGHSKEAGAAYAAYVGQQIAKITEQGQQLGGFICESLQGVGGNLVMPDNYLAEAYKMVRAAGGVCIADEVQIGFGRIGSHWWGFESQHVVPDIVTIGKPIGNGHPLAAVITTAEIAKSFTTGMEYFNTFGGNPVSCAIGMAVLETIEQEQLMENALTVGGYFKQQLIALSEKYHMIGDVRGLGLFLGAELVEDRASQKPATALAKTIVEHLKQRGILLSLDGPFGNVFKIKPPMVINKHDVDFFIENLTEVFQELRVC